MGRHVRRRVSELYEIYGWLLLFVQYREWIKYYYNLLCENKIELKKRPVAKIAFYFRSVQSVSVHKCQCACASYVLLLCLEYVLLGMWRSKVLERTIVRPLWLLYFVPVFPFFLYLFCSALLLLLLKKVGSSRLRESDIHTPLPHNTILWTERREREKE